MERKIVEKKKNPADRYGDTPLHFAAQEGHLEICSLIIENISDRNPFSRGRTPLHYAAAQGHIEVCRLILDKVVNINPSENGGITPLHDAAENGRLEVCRLIIEKFIVFDWVFDSVRNPADRNGNTPLHKATLMGHLDVCLLIIENLQDKNKVISGPLGQRILHLARQQGHHELLELFKMYSSRVLLERLD